jgi:hypothetical protein
MCPFHNPKKIVQQISNDSLVNIWYQYKQHSKTVTLDYWDPNNMLPDF